jgi:DNA uptake protein ComE-like DNA-binding protein
MKHFRKIASQLLGFDRRERRGTYVLAWLLVILLFVRLFAFRPGTGPPGDAGLITGETAGTAVDESIPAEVSLFTFDPNTATRDELTKLGLTERQVATLVSYRNAGARFRRPQDLARVYGIDSATVARLMPWVRIEAAKKRPVRTETGIKAASEGPEPVTAAAMLPIDLNRCDSADLVRLDGIGPVLSARIIKYRRLLGGFVDLHQLNEVYGLDSSVVSAIMPGLSLTYDSVVPVVLDTLSYRDLARHPYIGPGPAGLIVRYRKLMGVPVTLSGLVQGRAMSREQALRLAPYVRPSPGAGGNDYEFISSKVLK